MKGKLNMTKGKQELNVQCIDIWNRLSRYEAFEGSNLTARGVFAFCGYKHDPWENQCRYFGEHKLSRTAYTYGGESNIGVGQSISNN